MSTYFIDLDGTIFRHGTNLLLPGARELLDKIAAGGHQIVFTTLRGNKHFEGHPTYSYEQAIEAVKSLGVNYVALITDLDSPRIVINDGGADAINHSINGRWYDDEIDRVLSGPPKIDDIQCIIGKPSSG